MHQRPFSLRRGGGGAETTLPRALKEKGWGANLADGANCTSLCYYHFCQLVNTAYKTGGFLFCFNIGHFHRIHNGSQKMVIWETVYGGFFLGNVELCVAHIRKQITFLDIGDTKIRDDYMVRGACETTSRSFFSFPWKIYHVHSNSCGFRADYSENSKMKSEEMF